MKASRLAVLLLLGVDPEAQVWKKELAECAALADTAVRLECFDSLARAVATTPSAEPRAPSLPSFDGEPGQWRVDVFTDPFDDSRTVGLSTVGGEQRAQLVLKCKQNKPDIFINWGKYLAAGDLPVLIRVGSAKAETKRWPVSNDKRSVFFPGDRRAFLQQLLKADRLLVQVTPVAENAATELFDLRGLPAAAGPLKQACSLP